MALRERFSKIKLSERLDDEGAVPCLEGMALALDDVDGRFKVFGENRREDATQVMIDGMGNFSLQRTRERRMRDHDDRAVRGFIELVVLHGTKTGSSEEGLSQVQEFRFGRPRFEFRNERFLRRFFYGIINSFVHGGIVELEKTEECFHGLNDKRDV